MKKPKPPQSLLERASRLEAMRRRQISVACAATRCGLRIEQLLQWLLSAERKTSEAISRSWEEWGATLHCDAKTAKRHAQRADRLGLLVIGGGMTRYGGDSKNRFAINWKGVAEILGLSETPSVGRGTKCPPEGDKMTPGGGQNAHAYKEHALGISLDSSLSTTSTKPKPLSSSSEILNKGEGPSADVVAEVAKAGVGKAAQFAGEAFARGDDVGAIIAAWRARAKAWREETRVFVLIDRLRNGRPGCTPAEGWPAADFPHLLPRPQSSKTAAPSEPTAESAKDSTRRLEAAHGASLDAMTPDERVALLTDSERKFHESSVRKGGARWLLLHKLEVSKRGSTEDRRKGDPSAYGNGCDADVDRPSLRRGEAVWAAGATMDARQHTTGPPASKRFEAAGLICGGMP